MSSSKRQYHKQKKKLPQSTQCYPLFTSCVRHTWRWNVYRQWGNAWYWDFWLFFSQRFRSFGIMCMSSRLHNWIYVNVDSVSDKIIGQKTMIFSVYPSFCIKYTVLPKQKILQMSVNTKCHTLIYVCTHLTNSPSSLLTFLWSPLGILVY